MTSSSPRPIETTDAPSTDGCLPTGCSLAMATGVIRIDESVLIGGSPFRALRLGDAASTALASLLATGLDESPVHRRLARRLVDAGLLNPTWPIGQGPPLDEVTIVIPVKDRPDELERLLAMIGDLPVVVVDDGSRDRARIAAIVERAGARLVALPSSRGPSAARNAGMAVVSTTVTCFLDSDCIINGQWLAPLLPAFVDPVVAAVAPRIEGANGRGARARFEHASSPLDLGQLPASVFPGSPVSFVPAACLLVRTSLGPSLFDEALTTGEDVDLVWRLVEHGWRVRYEPAVTVHHPVRPTCRTWVTQRWSYGTSASLLEARHGASVAPLGGSAPTLGAWAAAAAGLPGLALGLLGVDTVRLITRLRPVTDHPRRVGVRLAVHHSVGAAPTLARQVLRSYAPLMVLSALSRRGRRSSLIIVALAGLGRWWRVGRAMDPVTFVAISTIDDLAYCGGLWSGVLATRRSGALRPRIVRHGGREASE